MADVTHQQPEQGVPVPEGAEFLRVAGGAGERCFIAPVAIYEAEPGDVVVLPGHGGARYLGGGRVDGIDHD